MNKYLLTDAEEIFALLRTMSEENTPVMLVNPQSMDLILVRVLSVSRRVLLLAYQEPESTLETYLHGLDLICIARHEYINIQWPVDHVSLTTYEGKPALASPMPNELLRLQRRQYFRLTTSSTHPLFCIIPNAAGASKDQTSTAQVLDISAGGVAVLAPPDGLDWAPGMEFANCRVALPDVGVIVATLQVRNIFVFTNPDGSQQRRSGCQFAHLPPQASVLIRRYMMKREDTSSPRCLI